MPNKLNIARLLSDLAAYDFNDAGIPADGTYERELFDRWQEVKNMVDRKAREEENLKGAREQALAQMSTISEMVAALECDYERLQELRDDLSELFELRNEDLKLRQQACQNGASKSAIDAVVDFEIENGDKLRELESQYHQEVDELEELETAAGDCENEDEARERIQEDPLDISVRSDWQNIGEALTPSEFTILLCTGGPAVRIVGELDQYNQPSRAWLEYQDWFTPWAELVDPEYVNHSDLLTYCRQFYFGE